MPVVDGLEFIERLRRTPGGERVPVIVWTAKDLTNAERDRLLETSREVVLKSSGRTTDVLDAVIREIGAPYELPATAAAAS